MNKYKTPSRLRTRRKDFNRDGYYAEPHDFHRLWHQFLLFSPSYELARRFRAGKGVLSQKDQERLPADFARVLEVYDDFGDLQQTFFRPWLRERGLRLFGIPGAKPSVELLGVVKGSNSQQVESTLKGSQRYFEEGWTEQNRPDIMVLAIPLDLLKTQCMKEIKKFVDAYHVQRELIQAPKYPLMNKGMHRQNVIDAMAVLFIRAAKPSFKLWQVGVEAKVSPTYSKLFDSKTTKRNSENSVDFRILEMMTSRKLRLAKNLVENAARGRFPDASDPPHLVDFDPKEFNQIIGQRNRWIRQEQKKYQ